MKKIVLFLLIVSLTIIAVSCRGEHSISGTQYQALDIVQLTIEQEIEVATPVTYSRYLGTPNGTPYGYQTSNWDGIFLRTMQKQKEKSIRHLHFVGAHTEGSVGYNQTYKSGKVAVEEILHEKNKAR